MKRQTRHNTYWLYLLAFIFIADFGFAQSRHIHIEITKPNGFVVGGNTQQISNVVENFVSETQILPTRTSIQSADQWLVVALNDHNEKRFEVVVDNPLLQHFEVFNPETGQIESRSHVEREQGMLEVKLPESEDISSLKIYTLQYGELVEIDHIPVGTARKNSNRGALAFDNAEQVKSVFYSGDPKNRSDLVIVAEGYTENDLAKFENDVNRIVDGYFNVRPYRQYKNFFNVWRIEVPSNASGAGVNNRRIDNAFGARFGCFSIARLLCVDERQVERYVRARMPSEQVDQILVVVNTQRYGGAGGRVATMSLAPAAIDLALHEVGHSYANLADEYDYGNCRLGEPNQANVTTRYGRKWDHWVGVDNVDWYEGAKYCERGIYRPTANSMMRTLGRPFQAVNNEALILKTYEYVDSIDTALPESREVVINASETFSVDTIKPVPNTLDITWLVNNRREGNGETFTMRASDYSPGTYQVSAVVNDTTSMVRKDDAKLTTDRVNWVARIDDNTCSDLARVRGLSIIDVRDTAFTVEWNEVASATNYLIQLWGGEGWIEKGSSIRPSYTLTGLASGSTQYVRIIAVNACGNRARPSAWTEVSLSEPTCDQPEIPGAPVVDEANPNDFRVSWASARNAVAYQVQLWDDGEWSDYETSTSNSIRVFGIRSERAYVRSLGINACGARGTPSSWTEVIMQAPCNTPPSIPEDLQVDADRLTWTNIPSANSYDIYRWTGDEWVIHTSTSTNTLSITRDTPRYISVRAINTCGASKLSEWVVTR